MKVRGKGTRHAGLSLAVLGLSVTMVAAACGGSSKKASGATTTSTTAVEDTTTTAAAGEVVDSTTTTAAAPVGAGATTATTARSTTATTRKTTATTSKTTKQTLASGINNIVATTSTAPPTNVQPGGTFTYLNASDPAFVDADLMGASAPSDGVVASALYDTLMYFNSHDGAITTQIATALTSPDGVVWTLKIRPNIKFTDNTPYDAAAIKFNWLRLADPATKASNASFVTNIAQMDVVDAVTLKITLKAKSGVFPNSVVPIGWIGSPTAIAKGADQFNANPVGAGPFQFKSWVRGSAMTLTRNPTYWNAPLPYLDQLIIKPITDESQRVNTLNTGAAQMLWTRVPTSKASGEAAGMKANTLITNGGTNAYFNTTTAPFKDQRVREAVVRAIDRAQYAKVINQNAAAPINSVFAEQSPFYDSTLSQYPYDPVKAQQLFDAVSADNGGAPVTFEISGFAVATQITQSEYMQGVLAAFKNVKVNAQTYAISAGSAKLASRDFQMMLAGSYFIDPEPAFTGRYICASVPNYTGWCDAKFDADVNDEKSTLDANTRIADIKDAQKIFYAAAPSLYYDRGYSWMLTTPSVQNFDYVNDGWVLFDKIWLKTHS